MNEARLTGTYQGAPTLAATNAADNRALSLAQLMGSYNGEPTLAAQNATDNRALSLAQLLGVYDGQPTLAAQNAAADQVYKNAALAASQARAASGGSKYYGGASNSTQGKQYATADAYQAVDDAFRAGQNPDVILQNIQNAYPDLVRSGVNPQDLIGYFNQRRSQYLGLETTPGQL